MDIPTLKRSAEWKMLRKFFNGIKPFQRARDRDDSPRRFARSTMRPWGSARLAQSRKPSNENGPTQDVIFIRDIAQSSGQAWKTEDDCFWPEQLADSFRTFTFEYDSSYADSMDRIIAYDVLKIHALRLVRALQNWQKKQGHFFAPFIVARGYGGLICEQAYLLSLQKHRRHFIRIEGLILFETPHFRAGLAQWLLITAKELKIPCARTPQLQDWSDVQTHLNRIAEMQKEFRALVPGPRMACFFASSHPKNSLKGISPEWAVLPGVTSIPLDSDHFSTTKPKSARSSELLQLEDLINGKLSHRLSQETLLWHWMQSSQMPQGVSKDPKLELTASGAPDEQVGIPRLTPRQTEISSSHKYEVTREDSERGAQSEERRDQAYRPSWVTGHVWDVALTWEKTVPQGLIEAEARQGNNIIDVLDYLLALRGDQITISEDLLYIAAQDIFNGADILDLFLVMRGDRITVSEETLQAVVENIRDGSAIIEIILSRYGDQIRVTEEVFKAAAGSRRCGKPLIELLLQRYKNHIRVTEEILKAAAANIEQGASIMELLLQNYVDEIDVTEEILKAAAANSKNGSAILDLLLERSRNKIKITEGILKAAAANVQCGKAVMESLLGSGHQIIVTEEVVKAAVTNPGDGYAVLDLLVERYGGNVLMTEGIFKAAAGSRAGWNREKVSALLLRSVKDRQVEFASSIKLLLDTDNSVQQLLSWTANNDEDTFRLLLEMDQIDLHSNGSDGHTILSRAAGYGQDNIVKLLMASSKVDINLEDGGGRTPLARALAGRKAKAVTLLGKAAETGETELNFWGKDGYTPLFRAVYKNDHDMVKALVDTGKVKVEERLGTGSTALSWAAERGQKEAVDHLLGVRGIDVNSKDNSGWTPLSWAVAEGQDAVVKLLLVKGKADVTVKVNGETPLEQAERLKRTKIVQLLRLHSSDELSLDV
ncbi:hypothetical protein J7T55_010356 [Diaporthe amygdali]|uniref:uncharacterized protein n=1 Tax=Phomopsis amygdali TaxID=1214568 RepID=UPI0022FEA27B|nr:uncharacterized protein J7T55_010356 [Diaporthe amygdali]KAJ0115534.1 hypothetical protein J7T55_010356 [Diaporthe amygdali]